MPRCRSEWDHDDVTFACDLEADHAGLHTSVWERGDGRDDRFTNAVITWDDNPAYVPPPPRSRP